MKYTIFCFSGTGNSLYVANQLSQNLESTTVIALTSHTDIQEISGENHSVGFIFPSYFGNLPRIVKEYIEKMNILPNTWVFGIVTMGAFGQGSIAALQKAIEKKKVKLSYGCGVKMPANYVMKYNPTSIEKGIILNEKADEIIPKIIDDLQNKREVIHKNFITANNLYKEIQKLDEKFYADEQCVHCGICQKVCPVDNIDLLEGVPQWKGHCEHCTACINWCPKKAIQYGNKTVNRRRYHNPAIDLSDFIKLEEE